MVKFTAVVWKEGSQYVSLCPQIDVSSFGDSEKQALEHLKEAIELYLEDEKPAAFSNDVKCTTIEVKTSS